ncbi:MAG TPA: adenylate/guanylate cyclase domain-containing protein [Acidimicrobiales bacterium]
MAEIPDEAELQRLGLYDPSAPYPEDRLRLLGHVFELGASVEQAVRASRIGGLGSLSLDLSIRPPGEAYGLDDFAELSGLDPRAVRRLWLALGLPVSGPIPLEVTPDAAEALRLFAGFSAMVGEDSALGVTRVVGSSVARMAEAVVNALRIGVEVPSLKGGSGYSKVTADFTTVARDLLPRFLDAVNAVLRRHLVLVAYQMWSTDEDVAAVTRRLSIGFADMIGSTEAVRAGSVAGLAQMVRQFEELVWDVVTGAGGRVVKLIGDEAMFVFDEPAQACQVALDLLELSPYPVRVGLAHGAVVGLFGDYYGETVNLAARLVGVAAGETALVSDEVRRASADAFSFEPQPARSLKGFDEPIDTYRLRGP